MLEPDPPSLSVLAVDGRDGPRGDGRGIIGRLPWCSRPCCACRCGREFLERAALYGVSHQGLRLPEQLPTGGRGGRELRQLYVPVAALYFLLAAALCLQMWCAVRGWTLVFSGEGAAEACDTLRRWLQVYCIMLSLLPFVKSFAWPLAMWWIANGVVIRSSTPACQQANPALWTFIDHALDLSLWTFGCLALAAIFRCIVRHRVRRINDVWGPGGPAHESVVQSIMRGPPTVVPPGTECPICLEEGEDTRWRQLPCGHTFHETCLREWLAIGRRCPLCRAHLHDRHAEGGAPPALAAGGSVNDAV